MKKLRALVSSRGPQMTQNEVNFIINLSNENHHIVEFGSGLSTIIWQKYYSKVTSIETRYEWYRKIRESLDRNKTNYIFCPPESCAFGIEGQELWNERSPSDYGTKEEFKGYLNLAKQIIDKAEDDTIFFIDGNLRKEISKYILQTKKNPKVLLHDVIPEREYLNNWRFKIGKKFEIRQIDSLIQITQE